MTRPSLVRVFDKVKVGYAVFERKSSNGTYWAKHTFQSMQHQFLTSPQSVLKGVDLNVTLKEMCYHRSCRRSHLNPRVLFVNPSSDSEQNSKVIQIVCWYFVTRVGLPERLRQDRGTVKTLIRHSGALGARESFVRLRDAQSPQKCDTTLSFSSLCG